MRVLDFKGAVFRAHEWVLEEPYSRSAHVHTSNTAALVDDYDTVEAAAERGLRANPGDPILINNKAFAQLRNGRTAEAAVTFAPLQSSVDDPTKIAEMATYGLLLMSQGNVIEGTQCYEEAIRRANEKGDARTALRAALNLMISSVDVSNSIDPDFLKHVATRLRETSDPSSLGTAMSLSRHLSKAQLEANPEIQEAMRMFTSALKEGQIRLLESRFAQSVQEATKSPLKEQKEASIAPDETLTSKEREADLSTAEDVGERAVTKQTISN